jgi:folate-binding protein YgfZ
VDGPDAAPFLQGLLTNDVAGLGAGSSCHALMLDSSGHVQADVRVARTAEDGFTIVADTGHGASLAALLDQFHFSEDVDIIGPEPFAMVTLVGPATTNPAGADLTLPGRIPGTQDLIGSDAAAIIAAAGAEPAAEGLAEALRIEAGVPRFGVDHTRANLVQEAGLETTAVSFDKGCYLGQETVARVHYRGQVNRRLAGVALDGPADPGAALLVEGRTVGTLTSVAVSEALGPIGLAIVRREAPAGSLVTVEGAGLDGRIVDLPFKRIA